MSPEVLDLVADTLHLSERTPLGWSLRLSWVDFRCDTSDDLTFRLDAIRGLGAWAEYKHAEGRIDARLVSEASERKGALYEAVVFEVERAFESLFSRWEQRSLPFWRPATGMASSPRPKNYLSMLRRLS